MGTEGPLVPAPAQIKIKPKSACTSEVHGKETAEKSMAGGNKPRKEAGARGAVKGGEDQ